MKCRLVKCDGNPSIQNNSSSSRCNSIKNNMVLKKTTKVSVRAQI